MLHTGCLRSGTVILQKQQLIRELINHSIVESNLQAALNKLKPDQRLVNILFDKLKFKSVVGHTDNYLEKLASSILTFEQVCQCGGPRFVIRVIPVVKLNAKQLQD